MGLELENRNLCGLVDAQDYREAFLEGRAHNFLGPRNVLVQVNWDCYLDCKTCHRNEWASYGYDDREALGLDELQTIFKHSSQLGTHRITIVGTEPAMRNDLPEIIEAISVNKIKPELYLSGIVLSFKQIDAILEHQADVAFSIDGFSPEVHNNIRRADGRIDAFSKTLDSIRRLLEERQKKHLTKAEVRVTANMVLQKDNIEGLKDVTLEDIDGFGLDVFRICLAHGNPDHDNFILESADIKTVLEFAHRVYNYQASGLLKTEVEFSDAVHWLIDQKISPEHFNRNILVPSAIINGEVLVACHIGEMSLVIAPDGNVYPCLYLYDDNGSVTESSRDQYIIGNLRETSLLEIWESPAYHQFRRNHYPNFQLRACQICEYVGHNFLAMDRTIEGQSEDSLLIGW